MENLGDGIGGGGGVMVDHKYVSQGIKWWWLGHVEGISADL